MSKHNNNSNKKATDEKVIKEIKNNLFKRECYATIINGIATLIFTVISIAFSISVLNTIQPVFRVIIIFFVSVAFFLSIAAILFQTVNYFRAKQFEEDYKYYCESKRISQALLTAIKRSDFGKTCSVLHSTYGTVPDWNPINYCENILVYDIHQNLRNICIRLKELVVGLSSDFSDDMVTVDLIYHYPIDSYFEKRDFSDKTRKIRWRVIASGDHTSSNVNLHEYLDDNNSFYSFLGQQGYVFCNDKGDLEKAHHYIWSSKDYERGRNGSIVGAVIDLKNDNPEMVFVKSYLTITTFGRKLVEAEDKLNEEKFEKLFTDTVINSYKTLIEAELAQMFIRHGIKRKYINRNTGGLKQIINSSSDEKRNIRKDW